MVEEEAFHTERTAKSRELSEMKASELTTEVHTESTQPTANSKHSRKHSTPVLFTAPADLTFSSNNKTANTIVEELNVEQEEKIVEQTVEQEEIVEELNLVQEEKIVEQTVEQEEIVEENLETVEQEKIVEQKEVVYDIETMVDEDDYGSFKMRVKPEIKKEVSFEIPSDVVEPEANDGNVARRIRVLQGHKVMDSSLIEIFNGRGVKPFSVELKTQLNKLLQFSNWEGLKHLTPRLLNNIKKFQSLAVVMLQEKVQGLSRFELGKLHRTKKNMNFVNCTNEEWHDFINAHPTIYSDAVKATDTIFIPGGAQWRINRQGSFHRQNKQIPPSAFAACGRPVRPQSMHLPATRPVLTAW